MMTTSQHNQEYVIIMITTIKKNVVNEAVRAMSVHLGAHGLTLGEKLAAHGGGSCRLFNRALWRAH